MTEFQELMKRVRGGDAAAAGALVLRYERVIRATIRVRLTDPALRRQFDSVDVCQSVLASFFIGAAAGLYDFDRPEQLAGLLVKMAECKLKNRARDAHRQRRDVSRLHLDTDPEGVATLVPGPEQEVMYRDMLGTVMRQLSPEERELVDQRATGNTWAEIATAVGGTPEARRMQLRRAVTCACHDLGLDGPDDGDE